MSWDCSVQLFFYKGDAYEAHEEQFVSVDAKEPTEVEM